jgi:hypothetical protein
MLLFSCFPESIRSYKDDEVGHQGASEERNAEMAFRCRVSPPSLYAKELQQQSSKQKPPPGWERRLRQQVNGPRG